MLRRIVLCALPTLFWGCSPESPFESRSPLNGLPTVIYDNDSALDTYTDDYVMALASAGRIDLRAMFTTTSVAPYNPYAEEWQLPQAVAERQYGIDLARQSGFTNMPDGTWGSIGNLQRPDSGNVDETEPIWSPGAQAIVDEAYRHSPEDPVIVVVGGPLTTVASAYRLDPGIVGANVVVHFVGGTLNAMNDYNGWADGWAAAVALSRLRMIIFHSQFAYDPSHWVSTPHERMVAELPDTPHRAWMISKDLGNGDPCNAYPNVCRDGDGPAAVFVDDPGYPTGWQPVCVGGYTEYDGHLVPTYEYSQGSCRAWLVTTVDASRGTEAWWSTMRSANSGTIPPGGETVVVEAEATDYQTGGAEWAGGWYFGEDGYVERGVQLQGGRYWVELIAAGTQASGEYSLAELRIDHQAYGWVSTYADWQAHTYGFEVTLPAGWVSLSLAFVNNLELPEAGEDRNLWLDKVTLTKLD